MKGRGFRIVSSPELGPLPQMLSRRSAGTELPGNRGVRRGFSALSPQASPDGQHGVPQTTSSAMDSLGEECMEDQRTRPCMSIGDPTLIQPVRLPSMEGIVEEQGIMETPDDTSQTQIEQIADTQAKRPSLQHMPLSQIVFLSACRKEPAEPCVVGEEGVSTIGEIKRLLEALPTREDMQRKAQHFEELVKKM